MNNIVNLTDWDYPVKIHQELCDLLRVNPRVFIFPDSVRDFLAEHMGSADMNDSEAFADEFNNVVYFYTPNWTAEYRQWLIFHEMFHCKQYLDLGNAAGERWNELTAREREIAWEKEANAFADEYNGSGKIDQDFRRYVPPPTPKKKAAPRKRTKK